MNSEYMLLSLYESPRLTLEQTCKIVGITVETAYVQRCNGVFPIPMSGKPLRADVRDVAKYIDNMRACAV